MFGLSTKGADALGGRKKSSGLQVMRTSAGQNKHFAQQKQFGPFVQASKCPFSSPPPPEDGEQVKLHNQLSKLTNDVEKQLESLVQLHRSLDARMTVLEAKKRES